MSNSLVVQLCLGSCGAVGLHAWGHRPQEMPHRPCETLQKMSWTTRSMIHGLRETPTWCTTVAGQRARPCTHCMHQAMHVACTVGWATCPRASRPHASLALGHVLGWAACTGPGDASLGGRRRHGSRWSGPCFGLFLDQIEAFFFNPNY